MPALVQSPACPRCGGAHHEYVTLKQVSELLHVGKTLAWQIVVERGEIPHVRVGERAVRVQRGDLCAYLDARREEAVL